MVRLRAAVGTRGLILATRERRTIIARMISRRLRPSPTSALAEVPAVALLGPRLSQNVMNADRGRRRDPISLPGASTASAWNTDFARSMAIAGLHFVANSTGGD